LKKSTRIIVCTGAFATKAMKKDSLIAPMPLVPTTRQDLQMQKEDSVTHQLLMNYCFGHPESSLLFFPYGSTANFVNHSENPNAYIKWSSSNMSKSQNFEKPIGSVTAGLIMDIIALEDIALGSEVTINYGKAWAESWEDHVNDWQISDDKLDINPASVAKRMNEEYSGMKPFMTVSEMEERSINYPPCVLTACYSTERSGSYVYSYEQRRDLFFCEIIDRYRKGDSYWYDVKIEGSPENEILTGMPQEGIVFEAGRYCNDMHLPNAFRHEIEVPDDMYPELWRDLKIDEDDGY
jgi:hypothetical protein